MKQYLECGKIANTHGVRGAVLVESWCDSAEVLASLKTVYTEQKDSYAPIEILHASVYKGRVMAELAGVDSLEKAAALKGTILYADRCDLPIAEGALFVQDMIGLSVIDAASGEKYGVLSDVISGAASELYEVETDHGKFLIPAVDAFIEKVDLEQGVLIHAIEGLFS